MVRRRVALIAGVAISVVVLVTAWSLSTTPAYDATATLFVSIDRSTTCRGRRAVGRPERADSYAEIATSNTVLREAASNPDVGRTVDDLESRVSAVHPPNSVLINIIARDDDPNRASIVANAVAKRTAERVEQLEVPVNRQASASPIRVSVAQPARPPSSQSSPKVARNPSVRRRDSRRAAARLIVAVLREAFDRRLRDPRSDQRSVDLPVFDRGGR